jgi:hypothetical protein
MVTGCCSSLNLRDAAHMSIRRFDGLLQVAVGHAFQKYRSSISMAIRTPVRRCAANWREDSCLFRHGRSIGTARSRKNAATKHG